MNIFLYNFNAKYTRENIAKDFLFKEDSRNWFLTEKQLKEYLTQYIAFIPQPIWNALEKENWKIYFTNEELEKKFNISFEIYGITDYENKVIYVYAHELGIRYSLAHEIGHFLDEYFGKISNLTEWEQIKEGHQKSNEIPIYYFTDMDNNEEYFADCFLLYVNNKKLLEKCNKRACNLFDKIVNNMDALTEIL